MAAERITESTETKPGIYTTELWVTVLTMLLNNLSAFPIPDKYQGLINVLLPIAYVLSRGLAKQGQEYFPPTAPSAQLDEAELQPGDLDDDDVPEERAPIGATAASSERRSSEPAVPPGLTPAERASTGSSGPAGGKRRPASKP